MRAVFDSPPVCHYHLLHPWGAPPSEVTARSDSRRTVGSCPSWSMGCICPQPSCHILSLGALGSPQSAGAQLRRLGSGERLSQELGRSSGRAALRNQSPARRRWLREPGAGLPRPAPAGSAQGTWVSQRRAGVFKKEESGCPGGGAWLRGRGLAAPDPESALARPQAWRGTLARWRCRRLRAVYTIMRWFRRHKVRAHLSELHRRFQAARQPPLYGRDLVWPPPPAVLQPFQDTCQMLFCRYLPWAGPPPFLLS